MEFVESSYLRRQSLTAKPIRITNRQMVNPPTTTASNASRPPKVNHVAAAAPPSPVAMSFIASQLRAFLFQHARGRTSRQS